MLLKVCRYLRLSPQSSCIELLHSRIMSSASYQYLNLKDTDDDYSIIEMNRPPVNSFNLDFMRELTHAVDTVENNRNVRGLMIASNQKLFGAGLDLIEMCNSPHEHLLAFWSSFQELHLRLYTSPLATMAVINGHAVAAACALTLACDYRIMADGRYKMGLPTVHTGILVPLWISKLFKLIICSKGAERYLCLGKLASPTEALDDGLIDLIVPGDDLMASAHAEMKKWLSVPDVGRIETKRLMHKSFVDEFYADIDRDLEEFITMISDPVFLEHLKSYTRNIKKK